MTNEELKRALFSREPVRFLGMRYDYISAVIYRTCRGTMYITAELTDKKSNSVTIAHAHQVEVISNVNDSLPEARGEDGKGLRDEGDQRPA